MNWTPQQEDAIITQGRSVIVSAAAGSGKTAVLVERLVRILTEQRVRTDSIVVVTFTNDAAAQMKQRLFDRLTEQIEAMADSDDTEAYDWLLEQRAALSSARICTIHSFCFDLIREYAENCGVSSLFTIAEPAQDAIYQRHAMEKVLERQSRNTEEMELLFANLCTRDDSELEDIIGCIAEHLESVPFRHEWIKKALRLSADADALLDRMRETFCERLAEIIQLIRTADAVALDASPTVERAKNRYVTKLNTDLSALQNQIHTLRQMSGAALLEKPLGTVVKLKTFPRETKTDDPEIRTMCQQCCELYGSLYKKAVSDYLRPLQYLNEDNEKNRQLIPLLLIITEEYLDELFQEKCRQNVLGFSDAEELALELLGQVDDNGRICRTKLAETLSKEISLIMVDEYQDTNNKQDCLFKLLSKDAVLAEDGLHYGSNVFLVGDVKQSIYSFRQANPENFRRAITESIPLDSCQAQEMARIYLNQNFRSAAGVLDFVNALFSSLMTEACGEVLYDQNERLNFGSALYANADFRTKILIPQPEEQADDCDMQAECIADTVAGMLQSGAPVIDKDGSRPCKPGDFCILLRSTKNLAESMTDAFRKRGIPVVSDKDTGLLTLPEIRLICNLLRIADNPMNDGAMAAVLLSPVFGFSAEELALLKTHGKKNRLYLQLRAVTECGVPEALLKKSQAFLDKLEVMRRIAEENALEDCIQQIYDATDLLSLQGLYPDAAQRRTHLDAFMRAAKGYRENTELSGQSCLSGWLRYLDRLSETGNDLGVSVSEADSNSVSVKTIHKSKGLEYPFVFLAHPEKKFNLSTDSRSLLHADENGLVGLHLFDKENYIKVNTVTYQLLLSELHRRQKSEEMRLLYVALTRAKQQLFLVMNRVQKGDVKSMTSICNLGDLLRNHPALAPLLAPMASSMQDWLLYYLMANDAAHLEAAMEQGQSSRSELAEYCIWTKPQNLPAPETEPQEVSVLPDAKLLAQMVEQLTFRYRSPYTELASKYSVTQLAHPESSIPEQTKTPEFMLEDNKGRKKTLRGAAKGTAVHRMLQYLDMKAAAEHPEEELKRLYTEGYLNAAEAEAIKPEQLAAFFADDLYKRIAAAEEVSRERQLFVRIGELALPEKSALAKYAGTDGILIGTMDLLFKEPDGWVLVDYKTDYVRQDQTLLEEYSLQIGLYWKAAELILGERVKEAYLYSFSLGRSIRVVMEQIDFSSVQTDNMHES